MNEEESRLDREEAQARAAETKPEPVKETKSKEKKNNGI